MDLTATVIKRTKKIALPVLNMRPDITNPPVPYDFTGTPPVTALGFPSGASDENILYFAIEVVPECDASRDITLEIKGCKADASSGNVMFSLQYKALGADGVLNISSGTTTITGEVAVGGWTQYGENTINITIANANFSAGDIIYCLLKRDNNNVTPTNYANWFILSKVSAHGWPK